MPASIVQKFASLESQSVISSLSNIRPTEIRSVPKTLPVGSTGEFWGNMVKCNAPIQMMKRGLGGAFWREEAKLALAWMEGTLPTLKGSRTSDAWLGGGDVMAIKNCGLSPIVYAAPFALI